MVLCQPCGVLQSADLLGPGHPGPREESPRPMMSDSPFEQQANSKKFPLHYWLIVLLTLLSFISLLPKLWKFFMPTSAIFGLTLPGWASIEENVRQLFLGYEEGYWRSLKGYFAFGAMALSFLSVGRVVIEGI